MIQSVRLVKNIGGDYDILIEIDRRHAEFAADMMASEQLYRETGRHQRRLIRQLSRGMVIRAIRFTVAGVIVGSIAFSSFLALYASAGDVISVGYLSAGTVSQQIGYVQRTGGAVDTAAPSCLAINPDGTLNTSALSQKLVESLRSQGVRVVPLFNSNWDKKLGLAAMDNRDVMTDQLAEAVDAFGLDGIQVDIEILTEAQREDYVDFVRLLREKLAADKEVSVAVAANPTGSVTGWQGSYDYEALASYADYLVVMAYDEHYEGGADGPVASLAFVESAVRYALTQVPSEQIVLGMPFYGRIWSGGGQFKGNGINLTKVDTLLESYGAAGVFDSGSYSMMATFTVGSGSPQNQVGGVTLKPGRYTLWYDDEATLAKKMSLVEKYGLRGAACWSLGQEPISIWTNYLGYLYGTVAIPAIGQGKAAPPSSSSAAAAPAPSSSASKAAPASSSKPASSKAVSVPVPSSSAAAISPVAPLSSAPAASSSGALAASSEDSGAVAATASESSPSSPSSPDSAVPTAGETASILTGARPALLLLPAAGAAIVAWLLSGERVKVLEGAGVYLRVRRKDGQEGYVERSFVQRDSDAGGLGAMG